MINWHRSKTHSTSLESLSSTQRLIYKREQGFFRFLYSKRTLAAVILLWAAGTVYLLWSAAPDTPEIEQLSVRGEWVRTSEAPLSARNDATIAWNGSEVFVFGGTRFICPPLALCMPPLDPPMSDGAAYNPSTDTWREIAEFPVSKITARTASIGSEIFVLTWVSYTERETRLLRYQSVLNSWDELILPENLVAADIIAFGSYLILSNSTDEDESATDWQLDTATTQWTHLLADPLSPGFSRQYVAVGGDLYLFDHEIVPSPGGASGPSYLRAARLRQHQWTVLPNADSIGSAPSLISNGFLTAPELGCADGGETNGYDRCIPFGAVFDTTTDTWLNLPNAPERGTKYVDSSGGLSDIGVTLSRPGYPALDASSNEWFIIPQLDTDRTIQRKVQAAGPYGFAFGGVNFDNAGGGILLKEAWIWKP